MLVYVEPMDYQSIPVARYLRLCAWQDLLYYLHT